jgi:hypothetical protein
MDKGICWIERADPNIFILKQGHTSANARTYCNRCSVTVECANFARRSGSVGVWGGKVFTLNVEVEDITPLPILDQRPILRKLVYFQPGKVPLILGKQFPRKPAILGK